MTQQEPLSAHVTVDDCIRKHRTTTWLIGAVLGVVLGLVAMTCWSVDVSYAVIEKAASVERDASKARTIAGEKAEEAKREAARVQQSLNVQRAELNGSLDMIGARLETIASRQKEMLVDLKDQRKIIENLHDGGGP